MSTNLRVPLDFKEDVKRAVHELPSVKRSTMHPCLLIPLFYRRMKRGEKFVFSTPQMLIQSQPTFAPVLGNYRLRIEWYFNSDANHYGWIDNNSRLTTQEVLNRRHHTFNPNLYGCSDINSANWTTDDGLNVVEPFKSYRSLLRYYGNGMGSLLDYSGVTPGYIPSVSNSLSFGNTFNLDFILTYLNIIRCYHVNQQFTDVPYVARPFVNELPSVAGNSRFDVFDTFSVEDLDNLFMFLRYADNGINFSAFTGLNPDESNLTKEWLYINTFSEDGYDGQSLDEWLGTDVPVKYRKSVAKFLNYLRCVSFENCGLFCTEYAPDLYRNMLNKDADLLRSRVDVTTGTNAQGQSVQGISITEFRYANRLQEIYDRIQPFGGKDSTISRTRWGISSNREYDIPELICVQTEYVDTNAITSNNSGSARVGLEDIDNIPGDLSGNVNTRKYINNKQAFTANTPGTLMAIVSILPLVDYSENIERHLLLNNFEDEFSPQMAQRGFESVPQSDFIAIPTFEYDQIEDGTGNYTQLFNLKNDLDKVVGKQVAWLHDIAITNRTHGEFVRFGDLENWTLTRNYLKFRYPSNHLGSLDLVDFAESSAEVQISPYANPLDWQFPFVSMSIKDPNWYVQCVFDVKDISPVGYRFMPTLGR